MVFDVLDGHIARMTKQTSQFGKELDSLCDVITFGVAPVFIMFTYNEFFQRRLLWGIGALYAVAAILRLARFNVHKDEHAPTKDFQGLPTPMAAGAIASFAIAAPSLTELTDALLPQASELWVIRLSTAMMVIVPLLTGLLAWLMVSHVRYPHLASALGATPQFPAVGRAHVCARRGDHAQGIRLARLLRLLRPGSAGQPGADSAWLRWSSRKPKPPQTPVPPVADELR